jgi:hypothetical protein
LPDRNVWRGKKEMETICELDSEKALSDRELKKECFLYAKRNFQGKCFKNIDTGRDIIVSRDGLDEWYSKTKSRDQTISIKILDKLLENGKLINKLTDKYQRRNVESFIYFSVSCIVNGTSYKAMISVKQTKGNFNKFYHYFLKSIKIEPRSGFGTS